MTTSKPSVLVTGGAGFIGSFVCEHLLQSGYRVVNVDKLTYAANRDWLSDMAVVPDHVFHQTDIADAAAIGRILADEDIGAIVHLAAESHVDRSIDAPGAFLLTNVMGTAALLEEARTYWQRLSGERKARFRFHHVSTDEVFGDRADFGAAATETSVYAPSSPYSASKAAADHLVRAWHRTFGLPVVLSHASNNYGPRQFSEKLVSRTILHALREHPIDVYGDGRQQRDWMHVADHAAAIALLLRRGVIGETYLVGTGRELTNLSLVEAICDRVDAIAPRGLGSRRRLIRFVADRPGHDRRYANDPSKLQRLGWKPRVSLAEGLETTIGWYAARASAGDADPERRIGLGA